MAGGLNLLGGIAINRLRDSSQEAAAEGAWRAHASMFPRKLDEANQKNVLLVALHESNNYELQLALDALQRGGIPIRLLKKEVRDSLRTRHLAQNLNSKGYALDESTRDIRPL